MFRREWRQQLLILALVAVAVGATVLGAAVATNTRPPATSTFGTAQDLALFSGGGPRVTSEIASLEHRFGAADVIVNQTMRIPGSVDTFSLRAENPLGHFDRPLTALVSGRYPASPGQVALTQEVASAYGLHLGSAWHEGGASRTLVGIVENPDSLLDQFALVVPGQVAHPTSVTMLFDAHGVTAQTIGPNVRSSSSAVPNNTLNPTTIVLGLATVGMLLIALVSVGGFTVLAQRRLRHIGMVEALGAPDRLVRMVVRLSGVIVGVVGAVAGLLLGIAGWLAYRPTVKQDAHHLIGAFALPWIVIGPAMALAVLATFLAASRPARAITRIPIVTALSGRPGPPRQIRRSSVPGVVLLVVAFVLFGVASGSRSQIALVLAFVTLIVAVILVSPFFLVGLARAGRHAPVAVRLALRDLGRYRARSGSALAAISLGVLIAVIVSVIAAGRYGNPLDYAGPNLTSKQLIVYTSTRTGPPNGPSTQEGPTQAQFDAMGRTAGSIARSAGSHDALELFQTSATLQHAANGRQFSGPVYVATPALLRFFGIAPSQINPSADVLTSRHGLASTSEMQLVFGGYFSHRMVSPRQVTTYPCPKSDCVAGPMIEEVGALPAGTSAPNTVITEHALRALHLSAFPAGWFIQAPNALSASQIANARLAAAVQHMTIETKSSAPSSSEIINWATVFGIVLALGILAMSVGLIRSETASDLRTLSATGASGATRRTLTSATAGGLGLLGAVIGTACGYIACIGWYRSTHFTGLSALGSVPVANILLLVLGMPVLAALVGWLISGREPPVIARQPME
jgi:putative ABC transport system permease protein